MVAFAVEWTISLGNIVTTIISIIGFAGVGFGFFIALQRAIDTAVIGVTNLEGKVNTLSNAVRELSKVVVAQAVMDTKLEALRERLDKQTKDTSETNQWLRDRLDKIEDRK